MKIKFKRFSDLCRVPTKATPGFACYDVCSPVAVKIRPGGTEKIPLDIGFKFPKKFLCKAYPRWSLSLLKTFLGGGVIDSHYRVNVSIILTNFASFDVEIKVGDRTQEMSFEEVEDFNDVTLRGTRDFY